MFMAAGAQGNEQEPKKMYITPDQLVTALTNVGCQCKGDGKGMIELDIIDKNYKMIIEFKAFIKFVKKYRKGDAYEDSSCSSTSEAFEEYYRAEYRALDTTHQGYLKED